MEGITVQAAGRVVALPPLRMAMEERAAQADRAETPREHYEAEADFLRMALGEEAVASECGSADVDAADLTALEVLFRRVVAAYAEPVARELLRAQREQAARIADGERAAAPAPMERRGFERVR